MSTTRWNMPVTMRRGAVVEAKDESSIDRLSMSILECWRQMADICRALAKADEPVQITSEIWADTGRIIWVLKDRREFCRLELTAIEVERAYFAILHSETFESEYESLVGTLKDLVRTGFEAVNLSFASRVVMRDSDTQETEEVLSVK